MSTSYNCTSQNLNQICLSFEIRSSHGIFDYTLLQYLNFCETTSHIFLLLLTGRGSWLYYLSKQGYLRHIIESLASEDNQLTDLVNSRPVDHLKTLYVYETKMALLTRLASTATGSEMLLESGKNFYICDIFLRDFLCAMLYCVHDMFSRIPNLFF